MLWISLHLFLSRFLTRQSGWLEPQLLRASLETSHSHALVHSHAFHTNGVSQEENLCSREASTKLLAILSNRLKIITLRQKKISNIQAASIQMLGCHDFSTNAAGNFTKFQSDVPPHPWVELLFCLYSPTVCGSCSVVVTIPKACEPPRPTPGAHKTSLFLCAIKLPALQKYNSTFYLTEKKKKDFKTMPGSTLGMAVYLAKCCEFVWL